MRKIGQGENGVGNGAYAAPASIAAGGAGNLLATDVNLDGVLDLVLVDNAAKAVRVLLGNGTGGHGNGTFGAPVSYALTFAAIMLAWGGAGSSRQLLNFRFGRFPGVKFGVCGTGFGRL